MVLAEGLSGARGYAAWCKAGKRPSNVPSHPDRIYMHTGWQGWGHFLGNLPATYLPYGASLRATAARPAALHACAAVMSC